MILMPIQVLVPQDKENISWSWRRSKEFTGVTTIVIKKHINKLYPIKKNHFHPNTSLKQ